MHKYVFYWKITQTRQYIANNIDSKQIIKSLIVSLKF